MTTPHEITEACADLHCFSHNVDEAKTGWLVCGECMHVYPSARALRRDYRRAFVRHEREARSWSAPWSSRDRKDWCLPWWRVLWRVATVRASRVTFCQHCIHDF